MTRRVFRSFAKINLGLEVVGKLQGGYHELKTIFATLSLHDLIGISPRKSGIKVTCDHPDISADPTNLAWRAADLMLHLSGRSAGIAIDIKKRIAVGGGLGGGSSNAATVLRALDLMWGLGLGPDGLTEAARMLGADVPYFLTGGPALGLGRGDEIRSLNLPMTQKVVVVPGSGGVSTAAVFKRFATIGRKFTGPSRIDAYLRSHEDDARGKGRAMSFLRNDLEPAAIDVSAPLAETARRVRRTARSHAAVHSAMSGSGSTFFLLFDEAAAARAATAALRGDGVTALRCSLLSRKVCATRFEVREALLR